MSLGDIRPSDRASDSPGPLTGIRVVDLATFLAAPVPATMMADFGAEVIKVELPDHGDAYRTRPKRPGGRGLLYMQESRNKYSITLDVRTPKGRALLDRLLAISDVLVINFRPPTLKRLGLDPDAIEQNYPRLIALYISGYGLTGPYRDNGSFDRVASAFAGLTAATGEPAGNPVRSGYPVVDYMAGYLGAFGVMLALYHRDRTSGKGQAIDLALYEPAFRATEEAFLEYVVHNRERQPTGNRNLMVVPAANFPTQDRVEVTIHAAYGHLFERLAAAMGRADLANDVRFATEAARIANQEELYGLIGQWAANLPATKLLETLEHYGVPASRVMGMADIANDPHYRARTTIDFDDDEWGRVRIAGPIPKMSKTPGKIRWLGQSLGEGNNHVYRELLGLTDDELQVLRAGRVV
jgi:crotonobetainyl-CoA:carnitine CoA-transferase CaiB-like acyl-CoA transferase